MNIPVCERSSPSPWFIMDEGALYGCHNSALSTASSQTAPLRGSSQFIIDHPSSPHLLRSAQDERMRTRRRGNNKGQSWLLFYLPCLSLKLTRITPVLPSALHDALFLSPSCYHSWSNRHDSLSLSIFTSASLSLKGNGCMVMRWDEIRAFLKCLALNTSSQGG